MQCLSPHALWLLFLCSGKKWRCQKRWQLSNREPRWNCCRGLALLVAGGPHPPLFMEIRKSSVSIDSSTETSGRQRPGPMPFCASQHLLQTTTHLKSEADLLLSSFSPFDTRCSPSVEYNINRSHLASMSGTNPWECLQGVPVPCSSSPPIWRLGRHEKETASTPFSSHPWTRPLQMTLILAVAKLAFQIEYWNQFYSSSIPHLFTTKCQILFALRRKFHKEEAAVDLTDTEIVLTVWGLYG